MYDFGDLKMSDVIRMGIDIRALGKSAHSMEAAANELVNYLFDHFVDRRTGEKTCAMVRFFKTHSNTNLPAPLQEFPGKLLTEPPVPAVFKCLTLLATTGLEETWKSRQASYGHQAIPLPSQEVVNRIPMMRNLVKQMGMDIETVIQPDPGLLMDLSKKTFNVFHVPEALGSPYIPAQDDFVKPYGVRSVLGYGGILPSGNVFIVIMFTRVPVRDDIANLFNTLALNVKMLVLPFDNAVFA